MDLINPQKGYSSVQIEILDRICGFHQLYKDKDMEKHKYEGPAYKCVNCNKYGCDMCLYHKAFQTNQKLDVYICSPCYYRHQVKLMIGYG